MKKLCGNCKEIKEHIEFYKRNLSVDGLQNICKICSTERHKSYKAPVNYKQEPTEEYYYNYPQVLTNVSEDKQMVIPDSIEVPVKYEINNEGKTCMIIQSKLNYENNF